MCRRPGTATATASSSATTRSPGRSRSSSPASAPPTQLGRALAQLGVTLICAHSPQAKGRVERCWETLQDRLVKELRRAGASTLDEANAVLWAYRCRFNARFARPPADATAAYRRLAPGEDIDSICSFHYVRTVANDHTVRLEAHIVQIAPGPGRRSYAGCRVRVEERPDGHLVVVYQGQTIACQAPTSPGPHRDASPSTPATTPGRTPPKRPHKPRADHP